MKQEVQNYKFSLNSVDFHRLIGYLMEFQEYSADYEKKLLEMGRPLGAQEQFKSQFYAKIIEQNLLEQMRSERDNVSSKS